MTGDWIAEARADYQARPWVSWALAAKVSIAEPLVTLTDAANALVDHLSPIEAIDAAVGFEIRASEAHHSRALVLLRTVAHFLREDGMSKRATVDAMAAAYRSRGVEL